MAFRLPLDAKILMVPIAAASMLLVTMVSRVPTRDPEASRNGQAFYEDEAKAAAYGTRYENDVKQLFDMRIKAGKFGVFNNNVNIK